MKDQLKETLRCVMALECGQTLSPALIEQIIASVPTTICLSRDEASEACRVYMMKTHADCKKVNPDLYYRRELGFIPAKKPTP